MSISIKKYIKESSIIVIGQVFILLATIGGVKLLTTVMSPSSYGEFMLYNTVFIFSNMVLYNPLQQATTRFYNNYFHKGIIQLIAIENVIIKLSKNTYKLNTIFVIIFSIFFCYLKGWNAIYGCIFLLVYCITFSQITLYNTVFNTLKHRLLSTSLSLLEKILKPVLGAIIIYYFANGCTNALLGQSIAGIMVALISAYFYRKYVNFNHLSKSDSESTGEIENEFKAYMKSIPIRTVFLWIFLSTDRWILEFYSGSEKVGLYSALNQIGYSPLIQISSVISIFISPYIYDQYSIASGYSNRHKKIIKYGTIGFILLTIITPVIGFFLKDLIFKYLVDESFKSVAYLLPFTIFSGGLFCISQYYGQKALIGMKPESLIMPSIITSIFGVGLYIILGYNFEIEGIVGANIISNLILLVTTFYFCNK